MPTFNRVTQRQIFMDLVGIASTNAPPREIPRNHKIRDRALRCAFRDPHAQSDIPQSHSGVLGDAKEHVGMVG